MKVEVAVLIFSSSSSLTSTEARWFIRDGNRVGRGRESDGSTSETVRKRPVEVLK